MTKETTTYFGEINFFPYQPQAPMSEFLEWNSSVTNSIDGTEDRESNSDEPMQSFEMSFPMTADKRREAINSIYGAIREYWYVPLWSESQYVGDIASNQDTIACNTVLYNFNMQSIQPTGLYNTPVLESESSDSFGGLYIAGNNDYIFVSNGYTIVTYDIDCNILHSINTGYWSINLCLVSDRLHITRPGARYVYTVQSDGSLSYSRQYSIAAYSDNASCYYSGLMYQDNAGDVPGNSYSIYNESSGAIIDTHTLTGLTHGIRGMVVDDTYIYIVDCDRYACSMVVRKYSKTTQAIVSTSTAISVQTGRQSLQIIDGNLVLKCGDMNFYQTTGLIVIIDTDDMSIIETHYCRNYCAWINGEKIYAGRSDVSEPGLYIYDFDSKPSEAGIAALYNGSSIQAIEYTAKSAVSISGIDPGAILGAYLVPVKKCLIVGNANNITNGVDSTLKIKFMVDDNLEFSESTPTQYLSDDVYYDIVPEDSGGTIQKKIVMDQILTNFKLGPIESASSWNNSRIGSPFKKMLYDHGEVYDFRDFLYRRAGRYRQFWSPSFEYDLKCVSDGLIDTEILVESDSIIDYATVRDHIVIVDTEGNYHPRSIESFSQVDSERVELTLSSSLGLYDHEISNISFLGIYRLNSDSATITWMGNNVANVKTSVLELAP